MYLMRKQVDFSNLILKNTPNQYLCLPEGFKSLSKPHQIVNNYSISVRDLQSIWYKENINFNQSHLGLMRALSLC